MQARRAFFLRLGSAVAEESAPPSSASTTAPEPIGGIAYKVTANETAQAHFDRGVAYMWNFNHGAAIEAFKAAQDADPQCAMCYWGEAFSHGPNINAPMGEEAVAPAYAAVKKAKDLSANVTEKERALIDALTTRYSAKPVKNRAKLDAAFADAMDKVARDYPDDPFVLSLAAEANMDTQPWDYWEKDGRTPKGRAIRTVELIEKALALDPNYNPAIHLYIHMTEASDDPYRAAPFADRLASLSPGLGHLIHMPGHTYFAIGRFKQSLATNVDAVAADEAFLSANKASPLYEFGYFVHNIHFVMASAQMAGDGATALDMAQKLDAKLPEEMAAEVPFAQPIKAAPLYAWADFGDLQTVLALDEPELPFLKGAWHYARGIAYARAGDAANARAEGEAIGKLLAETDFSALEKTAYPPIPATDILKIEMHTVMARAAAAESDFQAAVKHMTEAVALQEGLPYTEPPYWYYPAKQTLAAMALRAGEAERAEQLFIETLAQSPNNAFALYGLSEAYRAQGDKRGAKFANELFKDAWAGQKQALTLAAL